MSAAAAIELVCLGPRRNHGRRRRPRRGGIHRRPRRARGRRRGARALRRLRARDHGHLKIDVFRALFAEEDKAQRANPALEATYEEQLGSGLAAPIDGAEEAIAALRASGCKVGANYGGFPVRTRDRLLEALGWGAIADLCLSPSQVGLGRPAPDLVLGAVLRLEVSAVGAVAIARDTAADMCSAAAPGPRSWPGCSPRRTVPSGCTRPVRPTSSTRWPNFRHCSTGH